MRYVFVPIAAASLPTLRYSPPEGKIRYQEAKITIGKYEYLFSKQIFPPDDWLSDYFPVGFYKKLKPLNNVDSALRSNNDLQGTRLDVGCTNSDAVGNDIGDQPHYKLVMDLIYNQLLQIASDRKTSGMWIVNSLEDSSKRDAIYDRFARRIASKYPYAVYRFLMPHGQDERARFLKRIGD